MLKEYHKLTVLNLYLRLLFKGLACGLQLACGPQWQLGGCYTELLSPLLATWRLFGGCHTELLCPLWTKDVA